jgi:thioredoxin-related protein
MLRHFLRLALASAFTLTMVTSAFAVQLVMVEQKGCHYCEAWLDDIGPAYPKTDEGKFAPLMRRDISLGAPEGGAFQRRVNFTPTFILMDKDAEIGRIEGYPGEDFFWPLLNKLLKDNTSFKDSTN